MAKARWYRPEQSIDSLFGHLATFEPPLLRFSPSFVGLRPSGPFEH